jgi:hypothetical protein
MAMAVIEKVHVRGWGNAKGRQEMVKLVERPDGACWVAHTFMAYEATGFTYEDSTRGTDASGWHGYAWMTNFDLTDNWHDDPRRTYQERVQWTEQDVREASICHCIQCRVGGGECLHSEPEDYGEPEGPIERDPDERSDDTLFIWHLAPAPMCPDDDTDDLPF